MPAFRVSLTYKFRAGAGYDTSQKGNSLVWRNTDQGSVIASLASSNSNIQLARSPQYSLHKGIILHAPAFILLKGNIKMEQTYFPILVPHT